MRCLEGGAFGVLTILFEIGLAWEQSMRDEAHGAVSTPELALQRSHAFATAERHGSQRHCVSASRPQKDRRAKRPWPDEAATSQSKGVGEPARWTPAKSSPSTGASPGKAEALHA